MVAALAGASILLDPTGIFGLRLVPPAEQTSRDDKAALFVALPSPPEVLVLGSSRAWCIEPERVKALTGRAAFNFGVDTATTDDLLAILRYADDRAHGGLRQILLAIEPEVFADKRDRTIRLDYSRTLRPYAAPGAVTPMWELAGELLISPTTIEGDKRSIRRLFEPRRLPRYAFDATGAADWPRYDDERRRGVFDFEWSMAENLAATVDYARRFTALSPRRIATFQAFLDLCEARKIEVLAFIPPVYPKAWETLEKTPFGARYAETEATLGELAAAGRIKLLSPRRLLPSDFGADMKGFYDHHHMTRDNGARMLAFLLERAR